MERIPNRVALLLDLKLLAAHGSFAMKKILMISRDCKEIYMLFALPALLNMGFSVDIFAEKPFNLRNLPPDIRNKIKVLSIPHKFASPQSSYLRLISEWVKMKRFGNSANNYDFILNVKVGNLYDPLLSSSAKVIYHLYDPMINHAYSYRTRYAPLMKLYFALLDNVFLNRCRKAVVLANSNHTQGVLAANNITSHVIYPPCKIDDLHSPQQKSTQVVSAGRISIEKRHEDTLEIARHFPSMKFIILGEPQDVVYYHRLIKLKTSNVEIVTPPNNQFRQFLRKYLAESAIYLHSCDDEAFGITIVEAMASGCVPIVRNAGGPREIITSESGLMWDSIPEAIKHVSNILSDEKLRKKLSSEAVERAKKFSPEVYQKRLIEIIQDL
jgi:glycosyltransferase involved in cell wall biosynthesis